MVRSLDKEDPVSNSLKVDSFWCICGAAFSFRKGRFFMMYRMYEHRQCTWVWVVTELLESGYPGPGLPHKCLTDGGLGLTIPRLFHTDFLEPFPV